MLPSPRFIIRKAIVSNEFMRLEYKDELKINWTKQPELASPYSSKYAVKMHLKTLRQNFEIPESVIVEPMIIS